MSGKGKNTTVKNPAWMLQKATAPPGSGVGLNTSMNKKSAKRNLSPTRTTRKVGSPPPSPKRPKKYRRHTRRLCGGNPRIMYE